MPTHILKRVRNTKASLFSAFWQKNATGLSLSAILLITVFAYQSVLFNFFCGDDFVHLEWLHHAVTQPELVWRNFYSNWLDVPTCKFYRPLISVFMFWDYALWASNGLGFHLTNLITHLTCTLAFYFVLRELGDRSSPTDRSLDQKENLPNWWALSSTALFALYPLHPEAVSWITGRVDTIVTMFFLGGLWLYLRARRTRHNVSLIGSLICFIGALMSKEMGLILPAVLICVEVFLPKAANGSLVKALMPTFPFWLTLVLYFILRRFALGTFVGGYDDSLSINIDSLISNWKHALTMILIPFNEDLFSRNDPRKICWIVLTTLALFLSVRTVWLSKRSRPLALFLTTWFILSLFPVFRLLLITGVLQGSRLSYMATAPLTAILCFGLWKGTVAQRLEQPINLFSRFGQAALALLVVLSFSVLWINNLPWHDSGEQSQAILRGLNQIYSSSLANPPTYLVGLPDAISGAYLARNALEGMTKSPQLCRDVNNCFWLDNYDRVFPFGFAKQSISNKTSGSRVYLWNLKTRQFSAFGKEIGAIYGKGDGQGQPTGTSVRQWQGADLTKITSQPENLGSKTQRLIQFSPQNLPCWNCQFVVLRLSPNQPYRQDLPVSLAYTNDLYPNFDWRHRVPGYSQESNGVTEIVFPLHSEIDWCFGGRCHGLTLISAARSMAQASRLSVEGPDRFLPKIKMDISDNQNVNGFIELTPKLHTARMKFDVRSIPLSRGVIVESSTVNHWFEMRNDFTSTDASAKLKQKIDQTNGTITLAKSDFGAAGIYQVRIRATDQSGKPLTLASDHLMVTVKD
jgi:hypothetical protein